LPSRSSKNAVGFLPIYMGLWVWLRWWNKQPFRSLGLESQGVARSALGGALVAALIMAVTAGLSIIAGATASKPQVAGLAAIGILLLSLVAYLVQGPGEEVLFRGWLLGVIGAWIMGGRCVARSLGIGQWVIYWGLPQTAYLTPACYCRSAP
jgi:membrane protease YdiL (CAAX protease family)